jgi:hypothetical protein
MQRARGRHHHRALAARRGLDPRRQLSAPRSGARRDCDQEARTGNGVPHEAEKWLTYRLCGCYDHRRRADASLPRHSVRSIGRDGNDGCQRQSARHEKVAGVTPRPERPVPRRVERIPARTQPAAGIGARASAADPTGRRPAPGTPIGRRPPWRTTSSSPPPMAAR